MGECITEWTAAAADPTAPDDSDAHAPLPPPSPSRVSPTPPQAAAAAVTSVSASRPTTEPAAGLVRHQLHFFLPAACGMLRRRALGERPGPGGAAGGGSRVGAAVYYSAGAAVPSTRLWWDALDARRNGAGLHSVDEPPGTSLLAALDLVRDVW